MVEDEHIVPVIGNELYIILNTAYTDATTEASLTDVQKALLDKCRTVIGPLASFYLAARKDVTLSDGGLRREETATTKTAFQYQGANFTDTMLREGERATEALLKFLDTNMTDYPDWVSSAAFTNYKNLFIKSGKEFADAFPSASPYRNYIAMRSKMQDVEENNIRTALGDELFNALKAKDILATPGFTAKEVELIKKLKKSIAYFTVAFSIPFLNVRIDANGITVKTANRTSDDDKSTRAAATNDALNSIMKRCEDAGALWLKNAIKYLNDNPTDFTGWPIVVVPVIDPAIAQHITNNDSINQQQTGSYGMA